MTHPESNGLKGQGRDLNMFGAHYLGKAGDRDFVTMEHL